MRCPVYKDDKFLTVLVLYARGMSKSMITEMCCDFILTSLDSISHKFGHHQKVFYCKGQGKLLHFVLQWKVEHSSYDVPTRVL